MNCYEIWWKVVIAQVLQYC